MISGPIPSPGRTRIFLLISFPCLFDSAEQPGLGLTMLFLEGPDGIGVLQRQADIIQTVEQAVLAERIDLEAVDLAVGAGNRLLLQIHGQLITFLSLNLL